MNTQETVLTPGDLAPGFQLTSDSGESFSMPGRVRPVVLFFYPQADTEGCTIEAIEFSGLVPEFEALNIDVFGVSPDSVEDLAAFRSKYDLKTGLLSDPDHRAIGPFGLWRAKKTFGRDYVGLVRTTFLLGPNSVILNAWPVTRIKDHAAEVLEFARTNVAKQ